MLLADEPVASLDPETARAVLERLETVVREQNLIGLVSLHQPQLADGLADHYLGLADGRLTLDATADEVDPERLEGVYEYDVTA